MNLSRVPVSVVLPVYNRPQLLHRALASVSRQTVLPAEILVVDDGSYPSLDRTMINGTPGAKLFNQDHRGVSAARNLGIRQARSEWIAFLDSDDEWLPTKLEQQYHVLTQSQTRLVHSDEIWLRNGRRVNPMKKHQKRGGHIYEYCLPLCVISSSAAVVHRNVFDDVGLFDESLPACEDYDLWLRICAMEPVAYVDEALVVKHGGHQDQLSRKHWGMDRFRIQALHKILHSHRLDIRQRQATLETLEQKVNIYCQGAAKRGRQDEVRQYRQLLLTCRRYGLDQNATGRKRLAASS